ncbi:hypothetical protein EO087_01895 [Dyella sp. M7H15-1]|uniref:hypothetical protein n=1 Tax=Dyella sp. M7H15-1 TaxID=2501295 RepID=UPI001004F0E6|nr:hypothetical protein [Dyella sp. M7H15-1]QAU22891.1 hypothetical protein EO087_01895 [Dyella sp. M7H15-1]
MSERKVIEGGMYDPATREWLGAVRLKAEPDGRYALPDNVVAHTPPGSAPTHHVYVLNAAGDAWELHADYRRILLWDTAMVMPVPNRLALGDDVPAGFTILPPPPIPPGERKRHVWSGARQAWDVEDLPPLPMPATEMPPEDQP